MNLNFEREVLLIVRLIILRRLTLTVILGTKRSCLLQEIKVF